METKEIDELIQVRDFPCLSIILPLQPTEVTKNFESLKRYIQVAKGLLKAHSCDEETQALISLKIDEAIRVLPTGSHDLGIFVSSDYASIIPFPFTVKRKIAIQDHFESRDLLYFRQYLMPYYVLNLSKQTIHLYISCMSELEEIHDGNFPLVYEEQYKNSGRIVNVNKGSKKKDHVRTKTVLSDVDAHLVNYMSSSDQKLIIAGNQKVVDTFFKITHHSKFIIGEIEGSFNNKNVIELGNAAWVTYAKRRRDEEPEFIQTQLELRKERMAEGLRSVWKIATEGRGNLLIMEKDFHCMAYQQPDQLRILMQPPAKPYNVLHDAGDELIKIASRNNTQILLTENDRLKKMGHLPVVLCY
ncbi:MAG TPA: hypothetical protein VFW11_11030 [Cyclobacteriaceae bacterium]|nr:hypothetical protein [Cyclobacteriaceae bacterium]